MKATELRELDESKLADHIREQRKEVFGLRFRHATGELENTAGMKAAKRALARALTVATQRGMNIDEIR